VALASSARKATQTAIAASRRGTSERDHRLEESDIWSATALRHRSGHPEKSVFDPHRHSAPDIVVPHNTTLLAV
jgi:hypothetical protein